MSKLGGVALAGVLAAAAAWAGGPDTRLSAPPTVDTSPTGYACTPETLVSGARCVFEGEAAPPKEGAPNWNMANVGSELCAPVARAPNEARPDAGVKAWCEGEVSKAIRRCTDTPSALLDAAGRFLPSARSCYASLGEVLAQARLLGATVAPCCRCLAEHQCGDAGRCVKAGPAAILASAAGPCAAKSCPDSCGAFLPEDRGADSPKDDAAPPAPGRPASPRFDTPTSIKEI